MPRGQLLLDQDLFYLQSQHNPPALNRPPKWSSKFSPPPLHWVHAIAPVGSHKIVITNEMSCIYARKVNILNSWCRRVTTKCNFDSSVHLKHYNMINTAYNLCHHRIILAIAKLLQHAKSAHVYSMCTSKKWCTEVKSTLFTSKVSTKSVPRMIKQLTSILYVLFIKYIKPWSLVIISAQAKCNNKFRLRKHHGSLKILWRNLEVAMPRVSEKMDAWHTAPKILKWVKMSKFPLMGRFG